MDRADWLREQQREAEERYDELWAPLYSEKWGTYSNATHQQFLQRFLSLVPQSGAILDAACGAGRYMPMLLEKGYTVIGVDQAQGMLAHVQAQFPTVHTEKMALQDLAYREVFEGIICVDALEHVWPEAWPLILGNFYRALKPQGHLYFTVERAEETEVQAAFERGQRLGWPIVYGEWADMEEVYHYYPSLEQVRIWLQQAGFEVLYEGAGDDYYHLIVRKASADTDALPTVGKDEG
jgi:2-polyprenyl-3-methyl-5-hydroxy-6-metoxy-1,4-benzoquinol methylase